MTGAKAGVKRVFICGSALRGQPDHDILQPATFIREAKTQPAYRLHAAPEDKHPAIYSIETAGIAIPGEVYELTQSQFDDLVASEPPHLYPAEIALEDGEVLTAFLYPREQVEQYGLPDISEYGGWAAYKARN